MTISKKEWEKRKAATAERNKEYKANYQRANYKFLNIKFKVNDEQDQMIMEYLESQKPKTKCDTIKEILIDYIKRAKN